MGEAGGHPLTNLMIMLNVAAFLLVFSLPEGLFDQAFGLLDFSAGSSLQLWRWVTSLFLHADASHLFFNMIALYVFGRIFEEDAGPGKWLAVYFASGIAGSALFGLTSLMPAVGASGCIFGLMGGAMLLKPKEIVNLYVIPLPLGLIAALYMLSQVALAASPPATAGVAYMAHIGGLLAGSALTFWFKPRDAAKGLLMLLALFGLLLILFPLVSLAVDIGSIILDVIDYAVGIVLYGAAGLLSHVWQSF